MLQAHLPPTTPREALHALSDVHADHTVLSVDWRNLGVYIVCSCDAKRRWYIDTDRAADSGLTLVELRHALRNAPRKPTTETRDSR